ncbi:MAG: DNA-binding response regulator [Pedobacter sp.]|jgi:DNA-binding LytR/AlgR family response regulator|nr:DNA-binding response regulator [Pedobacter sp.]
MLRAIAIDDEPVALEVIKSLAKQVLFLSMEGYFSNPFRALEKLQEGQIDLLFLDIKMPGISGTDFLKSITNPPMVIFTTAYSEHAVQSFELNAIDYVLKPFSLTRFLKACNKANEQYELRRKKEHPQGVSSPFFIKSGYEQIRVQPDEILYAESAGNYVKFVLRANTIVSRLTMSQAIELLSSSAFLQIHRSFIVATQHITKADKRTVWIGGTELPVGTAYSQPLQSYLEGKKPF